MAANVRLGAVTLLTGVGAGLGGMCLALLLHAIHHLAYGYSVFQVMSPESFLQGVSAASSGCRLLVMLLCGLVAGFGWYAVYRFGQPLVRFCSHSHERSKGTGKRSEGEIVPCELVIASGDTTKMFDTTEKAFDDVPGPIQHAAKATFGLSV